MLFYYFIINKINWTNKLSLGNKVLNLWNNLFNVYIWQSIFQPFESFHFDHCPRVLLIRRLHSHCCNCENCSHTLQLSSFIRKIYFIDLINFNSSDTFHGFQVLPETSSLLITSKWNEIIFGRIPLKVIIR